MRGRGYRYKRFQSGEGLSTLMINPGINSIRRRRRRRLRQRGRGLGSIFKKIGKIGRTVVNNPMVRKFAKEVIIPAAWGAVKQRLNQPSMRRI